MTSLPKVLLLGDSIRMSYEPYVARLLQAKATVVGPAENCQYSLFTLSSIDRWICQLGQPDIVHWNNGLHDCGHNPGRCPVQIPIDIYRGNLDFILKRLTAMTTKIIWANTTPIHPDRPFNDMDWGWRNDEIDRYNRAARELMQSHGIPINDLHGLVWANIPEFLAEDQLHLSETGRNACAKAVADAVSSLLTP